MRNASGSASRLRNRKKRSAVFDCFDSRVAGLAMDTNMKAPLCVQTLGNAVKAHPDIRGAVIHSDRESQYTSQIYRDTVCQYGIRQSMNSAGGRCHACYKSM